MASAQQPRLWHGRGQIPAGKDWKENPPEPGTLLERDPQGDAVHLGVARLQSPAAPSPGPRTHGRQSPETQQAMSSEEAWGHWKMAWKTLPRSLPRVRPEPPGLPSCGSKGCGSQEAWCLAGLTLSELGPESREFRDNQTPGPRDLRPHGVQALLCSPEQHCVRLPVSGGTSPGLTASGPASTWKRALHALPHWRGTQR